MTPNANVAVVMVNYRTPALALRAAAAVAGERARLPSLRLVLVDGGSGDGSAGAIAAGLDGPAFRGWAEPLPLGVNGGFGWANNQAMLRLMQGPAPPDFIHLLNPDAIIEPGAIALLARRLAEDPALGAVGSLLLTPAGAPSGSAFRFPTMRGELARGSRTGAVGRLLGVRPVLVEAAGPAEWVTGASVMFRAEALKQAGLFDDGFFLYFEEVELMWRMARAGWTIAHEPASRVAHVGGAATGVNDHVGARLAPRLPPYWFAARRRFFALTRGRAAAAAASLAWLAGHALWTLRRLAGSGRRMTVVAHEGRDLLRHGIVATAGDATPAPVRWNDPPGREPAWMAREE